MVYDETVHSDLFVWPMVKGLKVTERSFEIIVETQYAINANSVYIIQWILM